jgi:hypothetical protein
MLRSPERELAGVRPLILILSDSNRVGHLPSGAKEEAGGTRLFL